MNSRRCVALVVLLSLTSAVLPARAQVAARPEQGAIEMAKHHFQQAIALYNTGDFSAALAEFQAAYQTKPAASILYNIGLTYKSLFLYNDAIHTLEQYLKDDPTLSKERRAEAEQLIGEMRALLAVVSLEVTPDGCDIKVDNRLVGQSPLGTYLIPAGRHVIEASREGYVTRSKELMVSAGVPAAVKLALQIIPKTGSVHISVEPASASVHVDGRLVPMPNELDLALGGHTLEATARGYQTYREEVLVSPGQMRAIPIRLVRPPLYKRAALWVPVAVGIVVIAGVGLGVGLGLGLHDDRLNGSLAPGKASVGK